MPLGLCVTDQPLSSNWMRGYIHSVEYIQYLGKVMMRKEMRIMDGVKCLGILKAYSARYCAYT